MHRPWFSLLSGKPRGSESSLGLTLCPGVVDDETQVECSAPPRDRLHIVDTDGVGSTVGVRVGISRALNVEI